MLKRTIPASTLRSTYIYYEEYRLLTAQTVNGFIKGANIKLYVM